MHSEKVYFADYKIKICGCSENHRSSGSGCVCSLPYKVRKIIGREESGFLSSQNKQIYPYQKGQGDLMKAEIP